jgi:cytosine/uracil/thiamine/allantoin permease
MDAFTQLFGVHVPAREGPCADGVACWFLTQLRTPLTHSAIGNIIIAAAISLNGAIGSRYHIPFSIASRASMGFYFSYFAVVSRLALALIYFG